MRKREIIKIARSRRTTYKVVKIGRLGEDLQEYAFDNGHTIQDVLNTAGISLYDGEEITNLNGTAVALDSKARNGQTLIISGNHKSGC